RLERNVVGEARAHHAGHEPGREQPHQLVLEREVEAALTGVALTSRTAAQLVVDAAALVPLGAENVEPADLAHVVALGLAFGAELGDELLVALGRLLLV